MRFERKTKLTKKILVALSLGVSILSYSAVGMAISVEDVTGRSAGVNVGSLTNTNGVGITSTAQNNVVNWSSYNVGRDQTVQYDANNYLNLIGGKGPSQIDGTIKGGGNIYLINPNGVIFGDNSSVNVGNLYVSTNALTAKAISDFENKGTNPLANSVANGGDIMNLGKIQADSVYFEGNVVMLKNADEVQVGKDDKTGKDKVTINARDAIEVGNAGDVENKWTYDKDVGITGYTLINNFNEFKNMKPGGNYMLATDVNASAAGEWDGVGDLENEGRIFFNGLNHTISNLVIGRMEEGSRKSHIGSIFSDFHGVVKNLNVANSTIYGKEDVGVIAGHMYEGAVVDNCHITNCKVYGIEAVGGLVGRACGGSIINSTNESEVYGWNGVGGIVGITDSSDKNSGNFSLINCQNMGDVVCYYDDGYRNYPDNSDNWHYGADNHYVNGFAGGLIGAAHQGEEYTDKFVDIIDSTNRGTVTGTTYVGGLVGSGGAILTINNCENHGNVKGESFVGGLVGQYLPQVSIKTGEMFGKVMTAPLPADEMPSFERCLNTGDVYASISNDSLKNGGTLFGSYSSAEIIKYNENTGMLYEGEVVRSAGEPAKYGIENVTQVGYQFGPQADVYDLEANNDRPVLPLEGKVKIGNVTIDVKDNITSITSTQDNNVIGWPTFNVDVDDIVQFDNRNYLNLVYKNSPSYILGKITAGGNVYIINPNGIIFGYGSTTNVSNLYLSTRPISNKEWSTYIGDDGALQLSSGVLKSLSDIIKNLTGDVSVFGNVTAEDSMYIEGNTVTLADAGEMRIGNEISAKGNAGRWAFVDDNQYTSKIKFKSVTYTSQGQEILASITIFGEEDITKYWLVRDIYELQNMKNNLTANYMLAGDIDAQGKGFDPIGTGSIKDGYLDTTGAYSGIFDGNGFTISNLTVNRTDTDVVGLFGVNSGVVKNVGLENSNITGNNYVGGIAGINAGVTTACYNTGGTVTGNQYVGGLAGANVNTLVGYNQSSVTGQGAPNNTEWKGYNVGGLAGLNTGHLVGYNTGEVKGVSRVGGLAGESYGTVKEAGVVIGYNTGNVSGSNCVGGLVGLAAPYDKRYSTVIGYNLANVTGLTDIGGLIGYLQNDGCSDFFVRGYNVGQVTSTMVSGDSTTVSGLVGKKGQEGQEDSYKLKGYSYTDIKGSSKGDSTESTAAWKDDIIDPKNPIEFTLSYGAVYRSEDRLDDSTFNKRFSKYFIFANDGEHLPQLECFFSTAANVSTLPKYALDFFALVVSDNLITKSDIIPTEAETFATTFVTKVDINDFAVTGPTNSSIVILEDDNDEEEKEEKNEGI